MFRDTAAQDRPVEHASLWRRHPRLILGGLAAIVCVALFGPLLLRLSGANESVAASRVVIASVERGEFVRDFSAEGRVVAAGSPTLYAPAAGSVTLRVQAGDAVKKDQVLAMLDSPELSAKLSQERSTLQSQQFEWRRARLDSQRGQVDQKTAQRELERSRKAFELGSYSELQALRSQDSLDKANFALQQNRFDVQGRQALVDRQQLVVADLERQVAALQIRSPVDGQVGQVQVADRASVARDVPLLTVVDLSVLEVEISVPESFARDLATGMKAELTGNGRHWDGTLSGVSPEVVGGQVKARVRFADDAASTSAASNGLRQNQRLSVRIVIDRRADVLSVARGSFLDQDGGGFAYVMQDDIAVKRPIRTGASSLSRIEILAGLAAGDQVVVSGTDAFKNADRVIINR